MSNPGQPMNGMQQLMTSQLTPEVLQQMQTYQDQQKRQAMAQALMQNNMQGQNAGIANAGSTLAGAFADKRLQNNAQWAAQGISPVTVTPQVGTTGLSRLGSQIGGLFGMGGS